MKNYNSGFYSSKKLTKLICNLIDNFLVKLMKNYNSGFYSIKKLIKLMCRLIENFFFIK